MAVKVQGLVRKAMRGDTAAFGEIIMTYQHLVYVLALQIVRDPAAAQDIAQETFLSAFEGMGDLRSEDAFPAWLRRIARNRAISWQKEQKRIAPLENAGMLGSPAEPSGLETVAVHQESEAFRAELWQIVSSLSDALKFPILLCYVNDIPTAEAARFLGIKEGTLRKRLHDGKKKLQSRIVKMAEKSLQEYRLPPGFAKRCICGCERARPAKEPRKKTGKEVIPMPDTKSACGCGCPPQPKKETKIPKPNAKKPKKASG